MLQQKTLWQRQRIAFVVLTLIILGTGHYVHHSADSYRDLAAYKPEPKYQSSQKIEEHQTPKVEGLQEALVAFKFAIEKRTDIAVRVSNISVSLNTFRDHRQNFDNVILTVQLRSDWKQASPSEFKLGLEKMMKLWIEIYGRRQGEQSEINAKYDGLIIGTITSDRETGLNAIVFDYLW